MTATVELQKVKLLRFLSELRSSVPDASFQEYIDTLILTATNGAGLITCHDFVDSYMKLHDVTVDPTGIYDKGDLVRNQKAFFYRLHESWKIYKKANRIADNISRDTIALEFESIVEAQWDKSRQELRTLLAPIDSPAEFDEMLQEFCEAVFGKRFPDHSSVEFRRQKAFVGHWLWQAQMKLHHGAQSVLRQGNESMLMFVSPQQKTGKSTTIRRLIEPWLSRGFVWRTDLNRLEDPFSIQNLAYNYVAFFDDMCRSSVKNMGRFKQIVTDDEVHFRGMYTQTEHRMPKLSSLIGSSNKTARELMHDTTGLRRFHEVHVNAGSVDTDEGIDLDALALFDHERLVRLTPLGQLASPLYTYITEAELSEYENNIRPRHVVELWIEDTARLLTNADSGILVSKEDLYIEFRNWAAKAGYSNQYVPNSESFGSKLLELGAERGRTSKFRGFYVNQEG